MKGGRETVNGRQTQPHWRFFRNERQTAQQPFRPFQENESLIDGLKAAVEVLP
jgi:hypothetical protein